MGSGTTAAPTGGMPNGVKQTVVTAATAIERPTRWSWLPT